jgi:Replication-relaxation
VSPKPRDQHPTWKKEHMDALVMLYRWGPLTTGQLGRTLFDSERTARRYLGDLHACGMVRRFKFRTKYRPAYTYVLRQEGFELAKQLRNRDDRSYIDTNARFNESRLTDARVVLHDLHAAGWALTATYFGQSVIKRAHGPRETKSVGVFPPRGIEKPDDVMMRSGRSVGDLQIEAFTPFYADSRLDVRTDDNVWTHFFIEFDRTDQPSHNLEKFRAYDALITGWGPLLDVYRDKPPVAIFVCSDPRRVLAFLAAADPVITGWNAGIAGKDEDKVFPGRQRIWFVTEGDVHNGSFRALRLPDHPPSLRAKLGEPKECQPVQDALLPRRILRPAPWLYTSERKSLARRQRQPARTA